MAHGRDIVRAPGRARRAWSVLCAAVAGEERDYTQGSIGSLPTATAAAAAIAESVLAVLAWWMFRRGTWKLKVV